MIAVWVGLLAACTSLYISHQLGWTIAECLFAIGVANFSTVVALLVTIQFEHEVIMKFRVRFLSSAFVSWGLFLLFAFGPFFGLVDKMRRPHDCAMLLFPLMLSAGFGVLAYGKIQDRLVAFKQKRSVLKSKSHENH